MNKNDYKKINTAYKNNTNSNIKEGYKRREYTPFGCPASTYCPDSKEEKMANDISCPEGHYCLESTIDTHPSELLPIPCPFGYYCPKNIKKAILCPEDKPYSKLKSRSKDDCFLV
jgi:hypothetical protein